MAEFGPTPRPAYYDRPDMAWVLELDPRFLQALTAPRGDYQPGPVPPPEQTLGPQWVRWIQANVRLGEGDRYGQAPQVVPFQRALIWKLAELNADLSRRFRFVLLSFGKGSGKSPLGGWVGSVDLAGPAVCCRGCQKCDAGRLPSGLPHAVRRTSPDVLNMASSYEQADLVLDEIRVTFSEGPLAEYATAMKGLVELKGARGSARRRPATVKQVDGSKATTLLVDEVHELTSERQENAYDVAAGGTAKRADSLVLMMSTAGFDLATLFGRQVARGLRGEFGDDEMFVYVHADEALAKTPQMTDEQIALGIRQANPLAAAGLSSVSRLVAQFRAMPLFRALRYFHNLWTPTGESWLPTGAWDACKGGLVVDPSLPTWVGVDMALTRDSAAIITVQKRADGKLQAAAKVWYPDGGLIDQAEADDYLRATCATHNVAWVAADEAWWPTLGELEREGLPIFRMPQQGRNMIVAYTLTYRAIVEQLLVHDGSPDFADQIASAVPNSTDRGWTLRKGKHKKRIDCAPALAGAMFASTQPTPEKDKPLPRPMVV
jgi:phage terminase large subunit-like protein